MKPLTYMQLVDGGFVTRTPLLQRPDRGPPDFTGNSHGGGSEHYRALDWMHPKRPEDPAKGIEGDWFAAEGEPVVSPCWGYVAVAANESTRGNGAEMALNILRGEPSAAARSNIKHRDWALVATGWRFLFLHLEAPLRFDVGAILKPGRILGSLAGEPFVRPPHVHLELRTVLKAYQIGDPRPLFRGATAGSEAVVEPEPDEDPRLAEADRLLGLLRELFLDC